MMIGIFSFMNAFFTPLGAVEEDGEAAAAMAAWSVAGAGAVVPLVWLSRTRRKSAWAEAGLVIDSSCT